jgi:DNA-binding transcriptional regulator YiaG
VRLKLRRNQTEFAKMMNVDVGTVSRWERGLQRPHMVHLRKIDRIVRKHQWNLEEVK